MHNTEETTASKVCSKCGEEKPLSEFHNDKSKKDGKEPLCKTCKSKKGREHYQANSARIQEEHRNYYEKNKEQITERIQKYRQENKTKLAERARKARYIRYQTDKARITEKMRRYYRENKEHIREKRRRRYQDIKEHILKRVKRYREANKAQTRLRGRIATNRRKARESLLPNTLTS